MEEMEKLNQKMTADVLQSDYAEKKIVFGEGKQKAKICMIGEAPGGDEEKQGRPFVGKAGQLMNQAFRGIGNFVNRPPKKPEIDFFLPYLKKELEIIQPDMIVTLGNVPLKAVTGDDSASIGDMHGIMTTTKDGYKLFPLYHPAAIIYNRGLSEVYQNDLQVLKQYV